MGQWRAANVPRVSHPAGRGSGRAGAQCAGGLPLACGRRQARVYLEGRPSPGKQEGVMLNSLRWESVMFAGMLLGSPAVWAGECLMVEQPGRYFTELDQGRYVLDDSGMVIPDMITVYGGDTHPMDCRCEGGSAALYFKSVITLPPGYNDGSMTYYIVHPSAQIGLKYRINDGPLIPAPFEDVSDGLSHPCGSDGFYHSPIAETGSKGTLSLYLVKGFTGKLVIPPILLARVYARWGTQGGYSATHINELLIAGQLIAPQTCRINDGTVINIDLGTLRSADILVPGALPANYTPQAVRLEYMCANITETMQIELTLYGQESADLPGTLQTSNPDIGVQVADQNMKPFDVNGGEVPLTLNYGDIQYETGQQVLYAWPVNTTGKPPATGPFNASALLEVEFH
ncbi:hypothetical protein CYR52_13435 [Chimaeribacter arupi]|uniref:Fimbrial-type adhesion domain-containing protein n=2 Tax=Enterobacterales TaxID=91347 RepID=A0A2N5EM62_9GAMM|nr:hypothetical protein CYR52_13435 [Chimaeribacter arupi]PLR48882.1 hypothetical protein CYR34_12125 [Chimaeribacter arupi]